MPIRFVLCYLDILCAACDRLSLVRPILGLYGELYANRLRHSAVRNEIKVPGALPQHSLAVNSLEAAISKARAVEAVPTDDLMVSALWARPAPLLRLLRGK